MRLITSILCLAAVACLMVAAGCGLTLHPSAAAEQSAPPVAARPATMPAVAPPPAYMKQAAVQKDELARGETAVDNALAWAQRYADANKKVEEIRQENRDLVQQLLASRQQSDKAVAELAQAQKELKDANAMLIDMRQELDKWKADILGFRSEIRASQQKQAADLERVLKLMGAEPTATTAPAAPPAKGANP